MPYQNRIILFVDILGFTSDVRKATNDQQTFNNLVNTLQYIQGLFNYGVGTGVEKLQFSDSLVISMNAKDPGAVLHMISNASFAMHALFSNGYLCKGVITIGELYHHGDILFGPEFLTAMKKEALEDYPCIKFKRNLIQQARLYPTPAQIGYPDVEESYIMNYADQIEHTSEYQIAWYRDYGNLVGAGNQATLDHYENIKNLIENNISSFNKIRILNKYAFLKKQFNNSAYLRGMFPIGVLAKPSKWNLIWLFPFYVWDSFISFLTKSYWKNK